MASAYLDQRHALEESMQFQLHLEICDDCRTYLSELKQVSLILKGAGMADAPPGLRGRIMSLIAAESVTPFLLLCISFGG